MKAILSEENVVLNAKLNDKEEAIRFAGKILVDNGYVTEAYIPDMLRREESVSTYIGNQIAIPHGVDGSQEHILYSGISFVQVPKGVSFGTDKEAKILIGIAGKNDEHLEILSNIAMVLSEQENVDKLVQATSKNEIISMFEGVL